MSSIDQQTQRRRGLGLTAWDRDLAFDGYTLLTPMFGDGSVYLLDMDGGVAHTWRMPHPPGLYGRLLPSGNLFYCGKTLDSNPRFPAWTLFKGGAVLEADWSGRVLWEVRHADHHHDARLTAKGNVLLLTLEPVPPAVAAKVQGGVPAPGPDRAMWADRVLEVNKAGETVWDWHAYEHLDPEGDRLTLQDWRDEWSHGNTVEETPEGNVLVSFRNTSTVAIIDRRTGGFAWKLGPRALAQQHDPTVLPSGNILIFDNGVHRLDLPFPFSRVLEVDPKTGAIVWAYRDSPLQNFFSPYIGGAQRLANGNTLISEGCFGRIFEVTAGGQVVWEYISPHFFEVPLLGTVNWVFRAFRYSREEVRRWSGGSLG